MAPRSTPGSRPPARRLARQRGGAWWKIGLVVAAVAVWVALLVGGESGLLRQRQARRQLADLEVEVARLEAENDSLRQVLGQLDHDPQYLERVAREELGMVKPGEQLYRVERPARKGE